MAALIGDQTPLPPLRVTSKPQFTCNVTEEQYTDIVEKTREYIFNGDIFQAVQSRQFTSPYADSLLSAYRVLRTTNPSPYMVSTFPLHRGRGRGRVAGNARHAFRDGAPALPFRSPVPARAAKTEEEDKALEREPARTTRRSLPSTTCWSTSGATTSVKRQSRVGAVAGGLAALDRALLPG